MRKKDQEEKGTKNKKSLLRRPSDRIVRIEQLEKIMAEQDDLDTEAIVSMYMPRRRARRLGAALLRLDRMRLVLLLLVLLVCILFIMAFLQEKMACSGRNNAARVCARRADGSALIGKRRA